MYQARKFFDQEFFHVFNRSIAHFKILNNSINALRFIETLDYYNEKNLGEKFSQVKKRKKYFYNNLLLPKESSLIKIISYCIMPDHYHLLIKILEEKYFSKYINNIENSFTRYFNIKSNRKGPLWEANFKAVKIMSDKQLLHVSRYIHLNPTTSSLVEKPENWKFSSYKDIICNKILLKEILTEISIDNPSRYKKFVENNIDYQKKLKLIKNLMHD